MNTENGMSKYHEFAEQVRQIWPDTQHGRWMNSDYETDLISVVVPTYNRAQFLESALNSVWDQTYRPIELLVVDDGSTDETPALVDKWIAAHNEDPQFVTRYLPQEKSGSCAARNHGLIKSTGEYIAQLDSDDLIHPQKLEIQRASLEANPEADFAWSRRVFFDESAPPDMPELRVPDVLRSTAPEIKQRPQATYPQAALFPRKICEVVGPWNESLRRYTDWDYSFRISLLKLKIVRTGDLYYHRDHSASNMGDLRFQPEGVHVDLEALQAIERTLKGMCDFTTPHHHRTVRNLYFGILRRALQHGMSEEAVHCFRAIVRHGTSGTRLKMKLLSNMFRLAGRRATLFALKTYSRVMTS